MGSGSCPRCSSSPTGSPLVCNNNNNKAELDNNNNNKAELDNDNNNKAELDNYNIFSIISQYW